jgi:transcriptional regulator with XRE-family HTH domain
MAARTRTEFERERDLDRTADMYLQCYTQQQIADKIGVSRQQIAADIKELERRWQKSAVEKIAKRKARQLAKVTKLENLAWRMLEKTNGELYEVMKEEGSREGASFDRINKKISESAADPRWAKILLDCWVREGKITGSDAPDKLALTDTSGKDVVLDPAACAAQAVAMLREMRERKALKEAGAAETDADDEDEEGSDA